MSYILFGGLFDPPHKGHMEIARSALRETAADKVYWLPSRIPPHRSKGVLSGAERMEILSEWLDLKNSMEPCSAELKEGHSGYTIETVKLFRKKKKNEKSYLLIGSDEAEKFTRWNKWRRILNLTDILVGKRSSSVNIPKEVKAKVLDNKVLNISSAGIRSKLKRGEDVSGELAPPVYEIIRRRGFYI